MLLGEMNKSNEDLNPQNSDLLTNQEKQQKKAEGSGQDL